MPVQTVNQTKSNIASSLVIGLVVALAAFVSPPGVPAAFASGGSITYNDGVCDLAAPEYQGSGAIDDPYLISDSESLWEMADCSLTASPPVAAHFEIINPIDASHASAGVPTQSPIGYVNSSLAYSFSGIVEGKNNVISASMSTDHGVGLFAHLHSATFNQLEIIGDFATSTTVIYNYTQTAGALAIHSSGDSVISGVTVRGSVSGHQGVGGLVGRAIGTISVSESINYAAISGSEWLGGILGKVDDVARLVDSQNLGQVSSYAAANANSFTGGLVGEAATLEILRSGNQGDISANGFYFVGGLVGSVVTLSMQASTNFGDIIAFGAAGGLVGISWGTATISGSENHGKLDVTAISGGLVGQLRNKPHVILESNNYGEVTGLGQLGGLVGEILSPISTLQIQYSYNMATISAQTNWVGGILGRSHGYVELSHAFNFGPVLGSTTASDFVGGLVGSVEGDLDIHSSVNGKTVTGRDRVGGLAGNVDGDLSIVALSYNQSNIEGGSQTGGLVGRVSQSAEISDSFNSGSVTGVSAVGGFLGEARSGALVSESNNEGDISASSLVGGFVGSAMSTLVLNTATNTRNITGGERTGGLVGSGVSVEVYSSLNRGMVSGTTRVGGLIGVLSSKSAIVDSENDGEVVGSDSSVGGLLGRGNGNTSQIIASDLRVVASSNYKNVTGGVNTGGLVGELRMGSEFSDVKNFGTVTGGVNTGGLVGNLYVTSSLSDAVNAGDVFSTGGNVGGIAGNTNLGSSHFLLRVLNVGNVAASGSDVGGIIGHLSVSTGEVVARQVSNTGDISGANSLGGLFGYVEDPLVLEDSANYGMVSGGDRIGGLIGRTTVTGPATIRHSFNIGAISGTSKTDGLVGSISAEVSIVSSYTSVPSSLVATSTTAQMQSSALYVGWDFESVWGFGPCLFNEGAPLLRYLLSGLSATGCITESSGNAPASQTPAPSYAGPVISSKISGVAGDQVVLLGSRLNLISAISIMGTEVKILSVSAEAITIVIPALLEPGIKDLVVQSTLGRVTFIGALEVLPASSAAPSLQAANRFSGKTWIVPGSMLTATELSSTQRGWMSGKFKDSGITRVVCTAVVTDQMTTHQRIIVRKAAKASCLDLSKHLQSPSVWVQSKKTKHVKFGGKVLLTVKG